MKRAITLGDGRRVSLRLYVSVWKDMLAARPRALSFGNPADPRAVATAEESLREFRRGMADRINRHLPGYGTGRKWSYQWQAETLRAAAALNTPRLRIYWLPPWLRARFLNRIARHDD